MSNKLCSFLLLVLVAGVQRVQAQGMHFSQYYNAPMMVNPANTALMSDNDYRLGANYRTQWSKLPVPYKTFGAFADFTAFKGQNLTNWLGIGVAFYNDIAGDGNLTLTKGDFSLAYHVQTNDVFMISAGLTAGYATRSVDYNKLYFGTQWDGFKFDRSLDTHEGNINTINTNYLDVGAGINFSYFPSELAFVKVGVGFSHINQPTETFYNGTGTNEMAIRPTFNLDGSFVLDDRFSVNPSIYYSGARGAAEITGGTLVTARVTNKKTIANIIVGVHYRYNESLIGSLGVEYNGLRIMTSFDYAMSSIGSSVKNYGAMEFGLVFMGRYGRDGHAQRSMNCPRFY